MLRIINTGGAVGETMSETDWIKTSQLKPEYQACSMVIHGTHLLRRRQANSFLDRVSRVSLLTFLSIYTLAESRIALILAENLGSKYVQL